MISVGQMNAIFGVVIYPVVALINAIVAWHIIRMVNQRRRALRSEENEHTERVSRLWRMFMRQRDAIDSVIIEITNNPATYPTFPTPLMEQLMSVHTDAYNRSEADPELGR